MTDQSPTFQATYSNELFAAAANALRNYQFRRYGRLLILCCVINALGFAAALWSGAPFSTGMKFIAFVVATGPLWLAYKYFLGPGIIAARLRSVMPAIGPVTVGPSSIVLPLRDGKQLDLPWSMVKVVQETESLFLLVVTPLWAYFVPKVAMPKELLDSLHTRAVASAA